MEMVERMGMMADGKWEGLERGGRGNWLVCNRNEKKLSKFKKKKVKKKKKKKRIDFLP